MSPNGVMRRFTTGLALVPLLLAGCGGGGSQVSSAQGGTQGNNGPPTTSVSGMVSFNGAPLAGVTVTAYNTNTNTVFQVVTTDANGAYSISGIPTSSIFTPNYQFWAAKSGYGFIASVGTGATVKRQDYTGQYNSPYGIYKTVIDFDSVAGGSVTTADFQAVDGTTPIVNIAATVTAPRFVDQADGTVLDTLTGLTWLKDAGCLGNGDWATALAQVHQLASSMCGLSDGSSAGQWRLPNLNELASLVDDGQFNPALPAGHPFANVANATYWTSTTYFGLATEAWAVRMSDGRFINDGTINIKSSQIPAIWAVRGTTSGAGKLPATGQYVSYAAGDDGAIRAGAPLSYARWIDKGDGTIRDTLTGLTWLKKGDCIHQAWSAAVAAVNALASGQCGLADGSAAGDWHMPSRAEMLSLGDRALGNHADFFDWNYVAITNVGDQPPIFSPLVVSEYYWTSTTDAADVSSAWTLYSCDFGVYDQPKSGAGYTLAVR